MSIQTGIDRLEAKGIKLEVSGDNIAYTPKHLLTRPMALWLTTNKQAVIDYLKNGKSLFEESDIDEVISTIKYIYERYHTIAPSKLHQVIKEESELYKEQLYCGLFKAIKDINPADSQMVLTVALRWLAIKKSSFYADDIGVTLD